MAGRRHPLRALAILLAVSLVPTTVPLLGAQTSTPRPATAVVSGTVKSRVTSAPVRFAAVRQAGGSASTLSTDAGRFRLELPLGEQRLEIRRIGYRPVSVSLVLPAGGTTVEVMLDPIAVGLERVVVSAQDDAARRIVAAAIRRKQQTRALLHDYRFDGDVRLVVRDLSKPLDSVSSVLLITQTRTSAYWEQPDRYQETIVARRQTGNLRASQNVFGTGRIWDFRRDRVPVGRFELASPVADDGLEQYDYRILDTLMSGPRRVFRLSVEPKLGGVPAFAGVIDIADSTFDVTGIDVGVSNAVRLSPIRNVHYQQRFADVGEGRWMPRSIELSLDLALPVGPIQFRVQQTAELSGFRFNEGRRPAGLAEYRIVVDEGADRGDSTIWTGGDAVPLTPIEQGAWARIDSLARTPAARLGRAASAAIVLVGDPDFVHANRVDGRYFGARWTARGPTTMPATEATVKLGYGRGSHLWQYRAAEKVRLSDAHRLWVGAALHDETVSRPTLTSPGYTPGFRRLISVVDPLDYYRERGWGLTATTRLVDRVHLDAGYGDVRQSSLPLIPITPRYSFFDRRPARPNDPIDEGRLRSLSAAVTYDSRQMVRQGTTELRLTTPEWTRLAVQMELSPARALASDFDYRAYSVRFDRRQQSFGMGITSVLATGGIGTSGLPAQRFFGVDGGAQILETEPSPFSTVMNSSFTAPRAAVLSVEHDFDRLLFTKSHLPLVRDIPFTFAVRGSVFWTDGARAAPERVAFSSPYREVGFSIGNLTPFAAPLNLSARFAWQLSRYPTTPFRFSLGLGR
jgi:hypothetical protein